MRRNKLKDGLLLVMSVGNFILSVSSERFNSSDLKFSFLTFVRSSKNKDRIDSLKNSIFSCPNLGLQFQIIISPIINEIWNLPLSELLPGFFEYSPRCSCRSCSFRCPKISLFDFCLFLKNLPVSTWPAWLWDRWVPFPMWLSWCQGIWKWIIVL